jgi:hypothetical protein
MAERSTTSPNAPLPGQFGGFRLAHSLKADGHQQRRELVIRNLPDTQPETTKLISSASVQGRLFSLV